MLAVPILLEKEESFAEAICKDDDELLPDLPCDDDNEAVVEVDKHRVVSSPATVGETVFIECSTATDPKYSASEIRSLGGSAKRQGLLGRGCRVIWLEEALPEDAEPDTRFTRFLRALKSAETAKDWLLNIMLPTDGRSGKPPVAEVASDPEVEDPMTLRLFLSLPEVPGRSLPLLPLFFFEEEAGEVPRNAPDD